MFKHIKTIAFSVIKLIRNKKERYNC